jgi:hypothetical protein
MPVFEKVPIASAILSAETRPNVIHPLESLDSGLQVISDTLSEEETLVVEF